MTQAEKLEALVRKAVGGGWNKYQGTFTGKTWSNRVCGELQMEWRVHGELTINLNVFQTIFNHEFAHALFGEKKKEWLGGFTWYSLYEQDSYNFKDADDLLNSWIYDGGKQKPTIAELESLLPGGVEVCAGIVEKRIETTNKGFKYHLQQAVIADNPIDYMYEAVFDE